MSPWGSSLLGGGSSGGAMAMDAMLGKEPKLKAASVNRRA
jgi:hypothetical protein